MQLLLPLSFHFGLLNMKLPIVCLKKIQTYLILQCSELILILDVSPEKALARAGVISGVAQTMALVVAPLFGILSDHVDKTFCQAIAAGIAALGSEE